MKLISILYILFAAAPTYAGVKDVGNGGDAVVCRNSQGVIQNAELLDYYEARTNFDLQIQESGSRDEILNHFLGRIGQLNSLRLSEYRQRADQFFSESKLLSNVELVDIPDSDHTSFPRGCKVEQLVIQKNDLLPGEKRYTINKDIWDALDAQNQAGIILHEIVYRETLGQHSRYVRYFNGLVASNSLKNLTLPLQDELLRNLGTTEFVTPPAKYRISYKSFDGLGRPKEATIWASGDSFNGTKLNGLFEVTYNDGKVAKISGRLDAYLEIQLPHSSEEVKAEKVEFYTTEMIKALTGVKGNHLVQSKIARTPIKCLEGTAIHFLFDGDLQSCMADVSGGFQIWHKTDRYRAKFYLRYKTDREMFKLNDQGYFVNTGEIVAEGDFLIQEEWRAMNGVQTYDNGLLFGGNFVKPTRLVFNSIPFVFEAGKSVLFLENGVVGYGSIVGAIDVPVEGKILSLQSKRVCKSSKISQRGDFLQLDDSGRVVNAVVAQSTTFHLHGIDYSLKKNDEVKFYWSDDGKLDGISTYTYKCLDK